MPGMPITPAGSRSTLLRLAMAAALPGPGGRGADRLRTARAGGSAARPPAGDRAGTRHGPRLLRGRRGAHSTSRRRRRARRLHGASLRRRRRLRGLARLAPRRAHRRGRRRRGRDVERALPAPATARASSARWRGASSRMQASTSRRPRATSLRSGTCARWTASWAAATSGPGASWCCSTASTTRCSARTPRRARRGAPDPRPRDRRPRDGGRARPARRSRGRRGPDRPPHCHGGLPARTGAGPLDEAACACR